MVCPMCQVENSAEVSQCSTCGASLVASDNPHALLPGTVLQGGTYAVGRCLGQGGFGITYQGSDLRLRRPVAIKEFFPFGSARRGSSVAPTGQLDNFVKGRKRFVQEGEALARFDHPGIVRVHAQFEENDTAYIVMEYLQGKTLEAVLAERGGSLPVSEALGYVARIGEALEVVHRESMLHRDVKPANIMIASSDKGDSEHRVVLIDFGAAREYLDGKTVKHSTLVTPGYALARAVLPARPPRPLHRRLCTGRRALSHADGRPAT